MKISNLKFPLIIEFFIANFRTEEIPDEDYGMTFYVSVGLTTILAALTVRYFLCQKPMKEILIDITSSETEEDIQRNDINEELEMNALDKGNAVEEKLKCEEINVDEKPAIMKD